MCGMRTQDARLKWGYILDLLGSPPMHLRVQALSRGTPSVRRVGSIDGFLAGSPLVVGRLSTWRSDTPVASVFVSFDLVGGNSAKAQRRLDTHRNGAPTPPGMRE